MIDVSAMIELKGLLVRRWSAARLEYLHDETSVLKI